MNILWLLLVLLVILALVGAPGIGAWNHSFGYAPSGLSLILVIVLLVILLR